MNRELKFRVWDKQQKKFHTDADWGISLQGSCIIGFASHDSWNHDKGYKINLANQDNLVVQQYTGLKDSKGNDIYEGDIVEFRTLNHENLTTDSVVFSDGAFILEDILYNLCDVIVKIIGNIFENPELLEH